MDRAHCRTRSAGGFVVPVVALALTVAALESTRASGQPQGPSAPQPSSMLIRHGQVIDGTGAPARSVDVRVKGDVIAEIAASLAPLPEERVIDASGKVVAPGFIDTHSHADNGLTAAPDLATQVRQGITTAIVGQDGSSQLPIDRFYTSLERLRPAVNFATTIGHGTVRSLVLGGDFQRPATAAEIATMEALVDRGMRDGALGLSSGLEYDPGAFSTPDEVIALAKVAARHGGYYTSHVRDEEHEVFSAWREVIEVGRQAKIPVIVSHIKLAVSGVWGKAAEGLKILEDANRDGIRATADWYPYQFWQSSIYVLIADRDFENREKWRVGLADVGGGKNVLITRYAPDPTWNGRTLAEIATEQGKDEVTTVIEMIRAAGPGIGVIVTAMSDADLDTFVAHPLVNICSDGGGPSRHPRSYGTFPRVLGRYVRERKRLSLPEAIAKMTGRSAQQVGLTDRGLLAVGKKADIAIFDPAVIEDRGTLQDPTLAPVGMIYVFVNGQLVLDNGTLTEARPGQGLRRMTGTSSEGGAR